MFYTQIRFFSFIFEFVVTLPGRNSFTIIWIHPYWEIRRIFLLFYLTSDTMKRIVVSALLILLGFCLLPDLTPAQQQGVPVDGKDFYIGFVYPSFNKNPGQQGLLALGPRPSDHSLHRR